MGWLDMTKRRWQRNGLWQAHFTCAVLFAAQAPLFADQGITVSDLPADDVAAESLPSVIAHDPIVDAVVIPSPNMATAEDPLGESVLLPVDAGSFAETDSALPQELPTAYDPGACHACNEQQCTCGSGAAEPRGLLQIWHENKLACWTVRAESLLLWRDAPNARPLMTTFDSANQAVGPTVFDANQLQSDMLVAPRISVSRLQQCGRGVEASYLYAGNFYAARSLPTAVDGYAFAAPGVFGNDWGIDGTPISAAQQQVVANIQSAEVNLREPLGWGANRFLIGFRWLQWWESWRMVDGFQDPTDPTVTGFDDYRSQCTNNLYGGQIGLDSVLWNRGKGLRLESVVKAGAYYNNVNGSSLYDYATSDGFAFSRQLTRGGPPGAAFVGEVGLTAVVPLRKNFDLRCGYFGLWLEGLAQPTNQLSNQTLTQIDPPSGTLTTKGSAVLQGLSLGLEGRW